MKTLLVTTQLGAEYRFGTERYVTSLGRALSARGYDVHYLAGDPLRSSSPLALGEKAGWDGRLLRHPVHGWAAVLGESPIAMERWLADFKPELVHLAGSAHIGAGVLEACRSLGIPAVVTAMDYWWICPRSTLLRGGERICSGTPHWSECVRCISSDHPRRPLHRISQLPQPLASLAWGYHAAESLRRGCSVADLRRWPARREILGRLLRSARQIIFPSKAVQDALESVLPPGHGCLIPYGLEDAWFENPTTGASRPPRRRPEELRIGFVGALRPHKGPDILLDALRLLGWSQTRTHLAGSSDDAGYLHRLEEKAEGLDVHFEGLLDQDGVMALLRSIDVLVVPSRWQENSPFCLLEAWAARLPVVGSRVAGVAERFVEPRLLFEPGSAGDLARVLENFVAGRPDVTSPKVDRIDEMCDATIAVYQRSAEPRAAR